MIKFLKKLLTKTIKNEWVLICEISRYDNVHTIKGYGYKNSYSLMGLEAYK